MVCFSRIANLIANSTEVSSANGGEKVEDEEEETASHKQDGITLAEKMQLWDTTNPVADDGQTSAPRKEEGNPVVGDIRLWSHEKPDTEPQDDCIVPEENDIVSDDGDAADFAVTHFPEAWQFLTTNHAYYWLLSRVRSEMLLSKREGTASECIRKEILRGLASREKRSGYGQPLIKAKFRIPWSLPRFLETQYPQERNPRLGSLITLVASGDDVQALSCAQYMSQVWPVTGSETLNAVQGALDKRSWWPRQAYKGDLNIP